MNDSIRVLCAWCNATIRAGDASRGESHGICDHCTDSLHDSDAAPAPARELAPLRADPRRA